MPEKTFADGYIDVAARLRDLREKHPDASLQPVDLAQPYRVEVMPDGSAFIVYAAACYRTPDDPRPGIGLAYEAYPGRTPYTRGSELQNAETSAWGRAIVAALAGDTHKGVASMEEVRNRQAERTLPAPPPVELWPATRWLTEVRSAPSIEALTGLLRRAQAAGQLTITIEAPDAEGVVQRCTLRQLMEAQRRVLLDGGAPDTSDTAPQVKGKRARKALPASEGAAEGEVEDPPTPEGIAEQLGGTVVAEGQA